MNAVTLDRALALQDHFGRRVAARLDTGAGELPHDIAERLRAARMRAVAQRVVPVLQPSAAVHLSGNGQAVMGGGDEHLTVWQRIAAVLPLLALVAGLVAIHVVQNERRANELAEVDAALLIDDLPPAAYADPGFVQFLKSDR